MSHFRRLVHEAHRRSLWQVLAIYAFGSWAAYQVILDLTEGFGLPEWVPPFAAVLFLIGLPIVLATAFVQEGGPTRETFRLPGGEVGGAVADVGGDATVSSPAVARAGEEDRTAPRGGGRNPEREERGHHGWRGFLTWRRSLAAGVVAFALLGAGTTGYMTMRVMGVGPVGTLVAKGVLEERDPIVLADFAATGADSLLGRVVTEALRIDLIESEVVRLAEGREVSRALELIGAERGRALDAELAREVAQREGLKAVLAGEVGGLGGSYVLSARLLAAADGSVLAAFRETAQDSTGLIDAVDRLSGRIRERVGESLRSIQRSEPLSQVATASLPALRRYSEAIRLMDETGDQFRGAELLEEAVALDSLFGMAWRKLGVELGNMGIRRERAAEALRRAYELRDRLPEKERYHAEAVYHFRVARDFDAAMEAYRKVLALDPEDFVASNNLPLLLIEERRWAEAESILQRAVMGPAVSHWHYSNLAEARFSQGKRDEAGATVAEAIARFPGNRVVQVLRVELAAAEWRWEEADSIARWVLAEFGQDVSNRAPVLFELSELAMIRGRLRVARRWDAELAEVARQLELQREIFMARLYPAWTLLEVHRDPDAAVREHYAAVREIGFDTLPSRQRMYLDRADFLAQAGRPDSAAALLERWERTVQPELDPGEAPNPDYVEEIRSRIAFERGESERLVAHLRRRAADGNCPICRLGDLADVFDRSGRPDSAIVYFERYLETPFLFRNSSDYEWLAYTLERLGQLHDSRGDAADAVGYYLRFTELWRDADPALQPRVRAAQERLTQLVDRRG